MRKDVLRFAIATWTNNPDYTFDDVVCSCMANYSLSFDECEDIVEFAYNHMEL